MIATQPKLLMLLYGVVGFLAVMALILLVVDRAPKRGREKVQLVAFLAPALFFVTIGLAIPAVRTTLLAFQDSFGQEWVGLANFQAMVTTDGNRRILFNTMLWVVLVPTLSTAIGLLYAILVDKSRFEAVAKVFVFMPMAISLVGASIIWRFMYTVRPEGQPQIGLLNQLLVTFGAEPRPFLQTEPWNNLFLIVVLIWVQAGFAMVVLSASIKAISADVIEAARLDGVNAWQMFRNVTLPSIRPAVIVVVTTITIATLKVFDIVRTMTGGNFGTSVVANAMYDNAFRFGEQGLGAAFAVVLFILVIPVVLYQVRVVRQRER